MPDSKLNNRVLLIDDDKEMRQSLVHLLESANWAVNAISNANNAEREIEKCLPDVVLTDVRMPGRTGIELLDDLAQKITPPIVLMSAHGDIPMAVDAIQKGAYSFLEKPFDPRRLLTILDHAAEQHRLQKTAERLKARLADLSGIDRIFIGNSDLVQNVKEKVLDLCGINATVLIIGETGTGKELVAKALHDLSPNSEVPFVAVNCAAIPVTEFEKVMFGRDGENNGLLNKVNNGTLFLDEITSAPIEIQAKLLRFLETKEFTPLGSISVQQSDARIIAACNEDPQKAIERRALREDFYYRLSGLSVNLPSLRAHKEDIPILFEHFSSEFGRLYEVTPAIQSAEDTSALISHKWPGNVRELRNIAERCILSARRGGGGASEALGNTQDDVEAPENLRGAVAALERTLISKAIRAHSGRMDMVAEALGIGRRTLNEKIVKLNIDKHKVL